MSLAFSFSLVLIYSLTLFLPLCLILNLSSIFVLCFPWMDTEMISYFTYSLVMYGREHRISRAQILPSNWYGLKYQLCYYLCKLGKLRTFLSFIFLPFTSNILFMNFSNSFLVCVLNYHDANFLPSKRNLYFSDFFLETTWGRWQVTLAWQRAGIWLDHPGNADHPVLSNELLGASSTEIWPEKWLVRAECQCWSLNPACCDYLSFSFSSSL